jgi:hypothetical protein
MLRSRTPGVIMRRALVGTILVVALHAGPDLPPGLFAQGAVPGQVTPPRAGGPGTAPAKGTAVLRGTVVAMDTGTPLRRAQVRAMTNDGQDNRQATTDDQGRFEITELVGGRYTINASKAGFVSLQYGQRRPGERGTPVELTPGQTMDKLAIALPRGGVIAGRITDDAGEPLTGVQVQAMRYMFAPGGRRLQPAMNMNMGGPPNRTDDQGAFRIFGLSPGDYYVHATMPPAMGMMMGGGRPAGDEQGFAPTYYPGTPSRTDAEPIAVAVGQEIVGLVFGLAPTRLARISGRVIGSPDKVGGFLTAMPDDGMMGGGMNGTQVQPDGSFELPGVPPGRYVLRVQPRGRDDELVGTATVTVAGIDLAGVTITMQRPGTMSGRIEFEGGAPADLRATQVRVFLAPADPTATRLFMSGPPEVADDFTFRARGSMGPVLIRANGPTGWYLKAVHVDGQDVTDTPVPLSPGQSVDGVRVLLTRSRTMLSGSVRDDRGNVVVDATVVVFPSDEARWVPMSRGLRSARPDTQGRYEINGLPPSNDYRIVAVQGLEDGQFSDPDFLAGIRDRAERLSLAEGETKAVDLRLRP